MRMTLLLRPCDYRDALLSRFYAYTGPLLLLHFCQQSDSCQSVVCVWVVGAAVCHFGFGAWRRYGPLIMILFFPSLLVSLYLAFMI